jgi:hypothetical protein
LPTRRIRLPLKPLSDDRPDETPISVTPKPAEGLSRRLLLGGLAVLPAVAGIPTAAAGADAELIVLGKKYEILVDRYYAARAVWAPALSAAHIERDTAYEAFG